MGWFKRKILASDPKTPISTNFAEWEIFLKENIQTVEIHKDEESSVQFKIGNFDAQNNVWGKDYVLFRILHIDAVNYIYSNQHMYLFGSTPFLIIIEQATYNDLSMYIKHATPDLKKKFFIPRTPQEIYNWIKKHFPHFIKDNPQSV